MDLPARARVVIVGGGAIGTSIAYHLAHEGWTDVVLLERDRLTSGTTWHAAGLMTCFGSLSETSTGIRLHSRELYARLEAETGQATGFRPVGLIEAAADTDRLEEYRRVAAFQRMHGLEVEEISPREIADLFPWARTDDLVAGFHVPGDGRVNPVDVTLALARGARMLGVRIVEGARVTGVLTRPAGHLPAVHGVQVGEQVVECEYVVNATGMWARELGEQSGVVVPNQAAEHYYLITDTIDGLDPDAPVLEDPAAFGYYREEGGGMMVGLFEPHAAAWSLDGIPRDASFTTLPPDWDRMAPFLETAMARVPVTQEVGIRTFFCGPESFTPDLEPAVGEAPGIRNYFVAAGLNSIGILSAGGLGRVVASWIVNGRPDVAVTHFDVARFQPWQLARDYRRDRTAEVLGTVYTAHTPGTQLTSARDQLLSPVHDRLVAAGAHFRDVSGWESPDWYDDGSAPDPTPTWHRAAWHPLWEAEHRAVREGVGLMDMSFMAKLHVHGPGAGVALEHVSAGRVDGEAGTITYTQWLDDDGHVVADLTVTKLSTDDFWVVASDTAHGSALAWLRRHVPEAVTIDDVTEQHAQLNVQGPLSRDLLTALGLDLADLPFRGARRVSIAGVELLLVRITYLGELGYELHVPAAGALAVWDAIVAAGAPFGLRLCGLKALSSLRLEKAYRDHGHDIDNTDCPLEVGLGFAIDWDGDFIGREAVQTRRLAGTPTQRLVQVLVGDPEVFLFGGEPVLREGRVAGSVRAASYGWTLGGAVGLAFVVAGEPVTSDWLDATWTVDVAGTQHPAKVSLRPLYDPRSERVHR